MADLNNETKDETKEKVDKVEEVKNSIEEKVEEIKDTIDDKIKSVTDSKNKYKWIVFLVGIGIILFLIIGYTIGKYNPDPNGEAVQELLDKMLKEEKIKFEQTLKEKNLEISNIQRELNQSQIMNNEYQKEIDSLKVKYDQIVEPKTNIEIRKRLKDMGYVTY